MKSVKIASLALLLLASVAFPQTPTLSERHGIVPADFFGILAQGGLMPNPVNLVEVFVVTTNPKTTNYVVTVRYQRADGSFGTVSQSAPRSLSWPATFVALPAPDAVSIPAGGVTITEFSAGTVPATNAQTF